MLSCQADMYVLATVSEDFKRLLNRIAGRFPTRLAFSQAVGVTSSRMSRALNAGDFPFNVENCLRLAKLSGESPATILRAAGKEDIADLIEELYGKDRTRLLSDEERDLLDMWNITPPAARDGVRHILEELTAHKVKRRRTA